jgi:APA family basic amino acid/polyamine antiporter
MYALPMESWFRLAIWLVLGLVLYFVYGKKNSKLQHGQTVVPKDPIDPLNPLQ